MKSYDECKDLATTFGAIAIEYKQDLVCQVTFPEAASQSDDCPNGVGKGKTWYQRWKWKIDDDVRPATLDREGKCSGDQHEWATNVAFLPMTSNLSENISHFQPYQ